MRAVGVSMGRWVGFRKPSLGRDRLSEDLKEVREQIVGICGRVFQAESS